MPLFPGHNYLGPGNKLDSGEPVDEDDQIAQRHDSAYESALTAEDISRADKQAVEEFYHDFSTTGNVHSLIGAVGLGTKQFVEKYTGILYPDMSKKYKALSLRGRTARVEEAEEERRAHRDQQLQHRRDPTQDPSQPSTSRDVSDIGQIERSNIPMSTDTVDAPDAMCMNAGPTGGVTNPGGTISTLYLHRSLSTPTTLTFKKSRLMHTWGFASKQFSLGSGKHANFFQAYNTSLAYVPVDWVPFYLSPSEYDNLPIGAFIKAVFVEIIPKGVRCSFDVGSTITGSANSMHVIFGKHCVGLNHKVDSINMICKNNASNPMTIDSIKAIDKTEFTSRFYGDGNAFHTGSSNPVFPSCWGANRSLPAYACIVSTTSGTAEDKNSMHNETGWPRLDNIIERYNLNEHINVPCITYSYKPRCGILKNKTNALVVMKDLNIYSGRVDVGVKRTEFAQTWVSNNYGVDGNPLMNNICTYENIIEKSHLFAYANNLNSLIAQPQVHIGLEPVQSNAPSDVSPSFVNASAEYEIRCVCTVGLESELMYAQTTKASKMEFPLGMTDNNQHYYITQNHVGGFYAYKWNGTYNVK